MDEKRYYTSGQMAELNGVSRKTLRLYQEKGVLAPAYVDENTGYRYYTLEQIAQLDLIQKLQAIGLTLQQIGDVLAQRRPRALATLMREQAAALEKRIDQLQMSRDAALRLADSCNLMENKPPCNQTTVEWHPRRRLLHFDVEPYDYSTFENVQRDGFYFWEMALRSVKRQMTALGLPMSLFQNVGCFADMKALQEGRLVITGAGVNISPDFAHEGCDYTVLPAGLYITAYCDGADSTHSFSQEATLVMRMLEEIRANGWELAGDYYGDVMADTPAFRYEGRENFMRLQIPIVIPGDAK